MGFLDTIRNFVGGAGNEIQQHVIQPVEQSFQRIQLPPVNFSKLPSQIANAATLGGFSRLPQQVQNAPANAFHGLQNFANSAQSNFTNIHPSQAQRYDANVPQFMRNASDYMYAGAKAMQGARDVNYGQDFQNPVAKWAVDNVASPFLNVPSQLMRTVGNAGEMAMTDQVTPSNMLKIGGQAAQIGLNAGSFIGGGKAGVNVLEKGMASKMPSFGNVIFQGAKTGAKAGLGFGAAYGASQGIQDGNSIQEQFLNSLKQGAIQGGVGAVAGGILGGGMAGIGHEAGLLMKDFGDRQGKLGNKNVIIPKEQRVTNSGPLISSDGNYPKMMHPDAFNPESLTMRLLDKTGGAPVGMSIKDVSGGKPSVKNLFQGQEPQVMGATRKFFTGGDTVLKRSGEGGVKMEAAMQSQRKAEDLLRGKWNNHIDQATEGLNEAQLANVDAVLRGEAKPIDAQTAGASKSLRNWFNSVGKRAEDMQFEIQNSSGTKTPFKMRENYAPEIYNFSELQKGARREKALQHLVNTGQARNLGEATQLLDGFIAKNAERKVGNLEKAREFHLPDFERNPKVYSKIYAQNVAKRFTEAEHFGKKDELVVEYINQIAQEGGDYMAAQKIFDYARKGAPQNKVVNAITQYNLATQLDLSAITNASQSINTMTEAGILNTLKGAAKGFTKEGKRIAEGAGVYDGFVHVKETGVDLPKIVKGVMWPFQQVENFNRRTAANTAVFRAKELVARHQKEATDFTTRKLTELGISPEKLATGKLSVEDMMSAAYELARGTQFKVDTLDVPTAWKTPAGKLVTQFQSFSFMQTKFIRDKVINEARKGNFAPLARFIPLAIGASYLTNKLRNIATGRDEKDQATNTDIRAWDKYLKAFGDFASGKIIQGEFLYDTYKNDYNTPLKKVTRTLGSLGGPTVGKVGNVLTGLESMAAGMSKNEKSKIAIAKGTTDAVDPMLELKRFGAGEVPFVGEYMKNKGFAYPVSKYSPEEKAQFAKDTLKDDVKVVMIQQQRGTITEQEAQKKIQTLQDAYNKDVSSISAKAGAPVSQSQTQTLSTKKMSDRIKQNPVTGEYQYFDANGDYASAKTEDKAIKAINKMDFEDSGKKFLQKDGYTYSLNPDGTTKVQSDAAYKTELNKALLTQALGNKDTEGWMKIAQEQYNNISEQLKDPDLNPADKVELENDLKALIKKAVAVKKGKKPKKVAMPKLKNAKISANRTVIGGKSATTKKLTLKDLYSIKR